MFAGFEKLGSFRFWLPLLFSFVRKDRTVGKFAPCFVAKPRTGFTERQEIVIRQPPQIVPAAVAAQDILTLFGIGKRFCDPTVGLVTDRLHIPFVFSSFGHEPSFPKGSVSIIS